MKQTMWVDAIGTCPQSDTTRMHNPFCRQMINTSKIPNQARSQKERVLNFNNCTILQIDSIWH